MRACARACVCVCLDQSDASSAIEARDCICIETGWKDPVDSLSVHAYIANCQNNEAQVEEKRKRENEEGGPSKRVTRGSGKKDTGPSQVPLPHNQPPQKVSMDEAPTKKKQEKEKSKGKSPLYNLQSDIEASTDLKKMLEERILNSKVEFTLGKVLGIAKKEFHDEIIDII